MIRRDAHSKSKVLAQSLSNGHATVTVNNIDIRNYMCVEIVAIVDGNNTAFTSDNWMEFKVEHSKDTTAGNYAAVPADDFLGTDDSNTTAGRLKRFEAAHATAAAYRWGYRGDGGYLKVVLDFSNTVSTNRNIAFMVIGMDPWDFPTADQT